MKKFLTSMLLVAPAVAALSVNKASAQFSPEDWGTEELGGYGVYLGTRDLRGSIAGIINLVLGFLGVLTTIIILIGGFKWMTSQGSSDKVDEAKKMIGAGVVGLVVILAAYAISRFVLAEVYEATV